MKRRLLLYLWLLVVSLPLTAQMAKQGTGIGIIAGDPTGISLKHWTKEQTAFAAGVAWSFRKQAAFHLHIDYLFHSFFTIKVERGLLPIYYGIGARIKLEHESRVGVRVPIGLNYLFQDSPLDLFLEVVPILELVPATELEFNAALGVRYFF